MTTQLLLLSTCGTSTLTNDTDAKTWSWLNEIANRAKLDSADDTRLEAHIAEREQRLIQAGTAERCRLSAELNGIGAVLDRWKPQRVQHYLIRTDTAIGRKAADLVRAVLERDSQQVQFLTAGGLRTDDFTAFREALAELTVRIEELVPEYRKQGWKTIFNLTGGFKSVNAYFQMLGMLHADRCAFLFEGASELMEIPRLPIRLAEAEEILPYLVVFRRLECNYPVAEEEVAGLPDSLVFADDGQVTLSYLGGFAWRRQRKTLLGETLLDPISPKLQVEKVRKEVSGLAPDRRVLVNQALDALAAHLDLRHDLPKSHTFKKLEGNPVPPSTHELYLWSDRATGRLFGHFDGEHFVADSIGGHL